LTEPPSLLVVAGLDPSGGAGLLADAAVASCHGLRAVGVATGLTEQDTQGVRAANVVAAETIAAQLRTLLSDVEVAAVKIGMVGSLAVAEAIADALALTAAPAVWDPVLLPTRGRIALFEGPPTQALELLAAHVRVITPNLAEAAALSGLTVDDVEGMGCAARALVAAGAAGPEAVLVTGGHLPVDRAGAVDVLVQGSRTVAIAGPWIDTGGPVHGTGCALSTAIACGLARGADIEAAARAAKEFVRARLATLRRPGRGLPSLV
jgi:hydroxymethylpyrimidine/phosphomethylpyrimidine kinase